MHFKHHWHTWRLSWTLCLHCFVVNGKQDCNLTSQALYYFFNWLNKYLEWFNSALSKSSISAMMFRGFLSSTDFSWHTPASAAVLIQIFLKIGKIGRKQVQIKISLVCIYFLSAILDWNPISWASSWMSLKTVMSAQGKAWGRKEDCEQRGFLILELSLKIIRDCICTAI